MLGINRWTAVLVAGMMAVSTLAAADDIKGDPYPLNVCPVSGEELGGMGDPVAFNHQGRDIKFCCSGCKPRFEAEPTKYIAELDQKIIDQQLPYYPLKTDLVSGEALPADKAINLVYFNRLVRFGDQKSVQKFMKDPATYLSKLDEAVIAAQKDSYPLDKCIISGEGLDEMGEPVLKVVANRLVEFCCDDCASKFSAQPGKYWSALDGGEAPEHLGHDEIHGSDHAEH